MTTRNSLSAESSEAPELAAIPEVETQALCSLPAQKGGVRCFALAQSQLGVVKLAATPNGIKPADLVSAYGLPATGGNGTIVAIVDAYDDPNAESDLAVYRAQFGLPPCITANGCFKKVNQDGVEGPYPKPDPGWAGEISLDVDMVSAVCPDCKILLVEANEPTMDALGAAVNTAVRLGAKVVSNSYGGPEDETVTTADTLYFNHPGVSVLASSGDQGYGASYPATSQNIITVGGTSLVKSSGTARGWAEKAWGSGFFSKFLGGAGSGCSKFIAKPAWQKDANCSTRFEADVSAVASPSTGPAVYDTYGGSAGGWMVVGGTSASSPLVGGILAVTGRAGVDARYFYAHPEVLNDVTGGSNGWHCPAPYFCNSGTGLDGPTGLGTPIGSALLTTAP